MTASKGIYSLAVIGGGTAAISAVREALELGLNDIALIEKRDVLGGECALNACVPMHVMYAGAKLWHELSHQGARYGLSAQRQKSDFKTLMQTVESVVQTGRENPFAKEPRVTFLQGEAAFLSQENLKITDSGGHESVIKAGAFIIATGAHPVIPAIPGLDGAGYILYHQATHLKSLPKSLAIIGGGRIGVEFAQLIQRLGSQVTLLERNERLLPREEPGISQGIQDILEKEGVQVFTGCDILQVETLGTEKALHINAGGWVSTILAQEIMIATGRKARLDRLKLEEAGVQTTGEGIKVNEQLQTSARNIWAIGDAVGPYRFTHVADYHGVVAVHNILKPNSETLDYQALPYAIYTDPAFARVGLSETQAKDTYPNALVLTVPLESVTLLRLEEKTYGLVKVIVDPETDLILGAHLLASQSEDSIHLLALAMHQKIQIPKMTKLIYAYPTKSQIVQKVLEKYRSEKKMLHSKDRASS